MEGGTAFTANLRDDAATWISHRVRGQCFMPLYCVTGNWLPGLWSRPVLIDESTQIGAAMRDRMERRQVLGLGGWFASGLHMQNSEGGNCASEGYVVQ